jgi:transcriptional regulator GlxA family with amidase domain
MIARELDLSAKTIARRVKAQTGGTVLTHIHNRRLACAKHLLTQTHMSVKEVAASAGFDSTASLDARFREAVGLRPSEYRRA